MTQPEVLRKSRCQVPSLNVAQMTKQITLDDRMIRYTLRRSRRARRMRLVVYGDGSVVVTMPPGWQESAAERFVREKTKWIVAKVNYFKQFGGRPIVRRSRADYLKYKDGAYTLARTRVEHFNTLYNFPYNKITIRNQKTRWGSCSKQGNLNFNYKIVLLPENLADYIIVHELCHLKEFNHSKNFWSLVAKVFPDYARIRKELRRGGIHFL